MTTIDNDKDTSSQLDAEGEGSTLTFEESLLLLESLTFDTCVKLTHGALRTKRLSDSMLIFFQSYVGDSALIVASIPPLD